MLEYKNKMEETNFKKEEQINEELNALIAEKDEELELLQENLKLLTLKKQILE